MTTETISAAHAAVANLPALTEAQRIALRLNDWRESAIALVINPMIEWSQLRAVRDDHNCAGGSCRPMLLVDCNSDAQAQTPEYSAICAAVAYSEAVRKAAAAAASKLAAAEIARRTNGQLYRREGARFVRV